MNFITLKELKKMVPVASEFKRVPGLKKILEDGIEVILRKQMENHAEVVVYKNGYVSYHAHERYTVFALHNCTHYYYESQGNEHQTIPHNHFEDMEWHIRLVLEGEDRLVRNLEARESETFSYAADVNPEYNNEMEDPRINVMDFVLNTAVGAAYHPQPFDWDALLGLLHKKPPRRSSYEAQLSESNSLVTTTQIAKEYGCGAKVFNRLLHLHGIQYRVNGQWVLYSEHHGKGYTSSLTFRLQRSDGSEVEKLHTAWTQKGRKFLYHTLKRRGVLPLAEQGG